MVWSTAPNGLSLSFVAKSSAFSDNPGMKTFFFLITALVSIAFAAQAAPPQQYSAQQTIVSAGTTMTNTVYADGGKMRAEFDMNGMKMVTILRPDKNLTYQLMPGNLYMELPMGAASAQINPADFTGDDAQRQDVGTETIDGIACKKQKVTANGQSYFMWLREDTEAPVKVAAEDGSYQIFWKDVTVGPQKAELFEVPEGYQKADMAAMQNPALMQSMMSSMMSQGKGTMPNMPAGMPAAPGMPALPSAPPTPPAPVTP